MYYTAGSCNWIFLASLLKLKQTKNGTRDPPPHDKNYEKIPYFLDHSKFEKYDPFSCTCSSCEYCNLMMGPNGQNTFLLENIPPLGNTSPKSGEGGFCIIFKIWSNKGRPEKKLLSECCWLHGAQVQSPVAGTPRVLLKLWGP